MGFLPEAIAAAAFAAEDGVVLSRHVPITSHTLLVKLLVLVIKCTLSLLTLSSCREKDREMSTLKEKHPENPVEVKQC